MSTPYRIVLTTYSGDVQAARALKAGAVGYLLKSMLRNELLGTIRTVHAAQKPAPQPWPARII